jgi:hypothetical protein
MGASLLLAHKRLRLLGPVCLHYLLPCDNARIGLVATPAAVAQWIEYWPPKPRVVGSIPASRTMFFLKSQPSGLAFCLALNQIGRYRAAQAVQKGPCLDAWQVLALHHGLTQAAFAQGYRPAHAWQQATVQGRRYPLAI